MSFLRNKSLQQINVYHSATLLVKQTMIYYDDEYNHVIRNANLRWEINRKAKKKGQTIKCSEKIFYRVFMLGENFKLSTNVRERNGFSEDKSDQTKPIKLEIDETSNTGYGKGSLTPLRYCLLKLSARSRWNSQSW